MVGCFPPFKATKQTLRIVIAGLRLMWLIHPVEARFR